MRIYTLAEIQKIVTFSNAIETVRNGFIAFAEGRIIQPEPMQMLFNDATNKLVGDCHVKAAQGIGLPNFVIKVASGFYNNTKAGLNANNGLVLVLSSETGYPIALLQDEGWLTQMRTAAAGALAASLKPTNANTVLGVMGTGTQALLQAKAITHFLGLTKVMMYGRNQVAAQIVCDKLVRAGLKTQVAVSVEQLCHSSDIIVTTTPATSPILMACDVPERLHIIAVGADSPGKVEIDPELMSKADIIVTDNHAQCLHHGDFGAAVSRGLVGETVDVSLCDLLAGKRTDVDFAAAKLSIVDLTGLGVQDLAIANLVVQN